MSKDIDQTKHPYSVEWDAYYDLDKNEWLESKCDDKTCVYCKDRPNRPLEEIDTNG